MTRPNIVFILPDQLRADFLSCYGGRSVATPGMDRLAAEGTLHARAYSASPVCVPARTALLTGMNAIRNRVTDNQHALRPDYERAGIAPWPRILADAGYDTAAVGKMHFHPWDARHGFAYRVSAEDKRWLYIRDDYDAFLRARGYRKYHGDEHAGYHEHKGAIVRGIPPELGPDRFVGDAACRYLADRATAADARPFALMVGFPGPHCPYDPDPASLRAVDPNLLPPVIDADGLPISGLRERMVTTNLRPWNRIDYSRFPRAAKERVRWHYAALVKEVDDEVGRILDQLDRGGLRESTVVILASDHGDYLGDHDLIGKNSFFEEAVRIPLLLRGPAVASGTVSNDLVELRDVTATILHAARCEQPAYMDARTLRGSDPNASTGREHIVGMLTDGWMLFDGRWKLHRYATGETLLFDLDTDPHEQRDLAADPGHREVYFRLDAALTAEIMTAWRASTFDQATSATDLSIDADYGREGWSWPYPGSVGQETTR